MPPTTPSVSQSVSAVTLTVSSGSPSTTVSQTFSDSATLAFLQLGSNSIQITDAAILSRFATPGLQCSNALSLAYLGLTNVVTPALTDNFVATPIVLSNFGPSFTYSYVSGGTGTFTLPQPTSNSSSPGAFSYSVVGSTGVVSVSGNVVTMLAAGSTTIRATQAAAGGYASAYVEASVMINPIAPTFSNSGVFTISSKNIGDAPFTPAYPTSNSSGVFTYTSSATSVATVNPTTGLVSIVGGGSTTIRATQAAAGGYTSAYVEAWVAITIPNYTWVELGADIDGEAASDGSGRSVSLSADGTIVAIGASSNSGNGSYSGHVRVYQRDASKVTAQTNQSLPNFGPVGWIRLGEDIDGEASSNISGVSVSLSADGTIVAIGAINNSENGSYSGHVRVYQRDASKVTAQTNQSLPNFGPVGWIRLGADIDGEASYNYSGQSVSLSADGTIVAIGANYNSGNGSYSGQVRVYQRDASKVTAQTNQSLPNFGPVGWNRLGEDIDGEASYDQSGQSVSLSADGTIVAIGAIGNSGNGSNSGHVRVYQRDASKVTAQTNQSLPNFGPVGWIRLGEDIDGVLTNDYSGQSVSLSADGTIVAIGAKFNDGNGSNSGHVRVYQRDASKVTAQTNQSLPNFGPVGWIRLGEDIDGETYSNSSGQSVSLSADGTIVAIGANYNFENGFDSGHVRVYQRDASKVTAQTNQSLPNFGPVGWIRLGEDIDGEASYDQSGWSVSLSADGTIVAIGAIGNSENGSNSGHVRVYRCDIAPTFGTFTLPSDVSVYKNVTITRQLTPPTSNSSGAFTITSSNTAVATITNNAGVYSINIIGGGSTVITATQAASGDYAALSVKSSLVVTLLYPTFGPFTLPSDVSVYKNVTITRQLTPPTSNSSGAFTITSSNTAVATITNNDGISSINVIEGGSTVITATQAASGDYAALSVTSSLVVTLLYPTFGPFTLPSDLVYTGTTITRQLTPPTSNSSGAFTFTSSNTAVATITNNDGISSINVIEGGYTAITATQAASGDYAALSSSIVINTIMGNIIAKGFSVITDSYFTGLDFNTGMTTLFTNIDDALYSFNMPNSNFKFNNAVYNTLYVSSNGWISFTTQTGNAGSYPQLPVNTFKIFSDDNLSTCTYKFDSNNTRLLVKLTGYKYGSSSKTFTVKVIIDQAGIIQMNYTLASTYTSNKNVIGYVGSDTTVTTDDIFLTIDGYTFNGTTNTNIYNLLNGKTIFYI